MGWVLLIIHIVGAVAKIIIDCKNGVMEFAAKHGDGIRFATPTQVILYNFLIWELFTIICILEFFKNKVNEHFRKLY